VPTYCITQSPTELEQYQSYLLDYNEEMTKQTLDCTTRLADLSGHFPARKHQQSQFLWANVLHLNNKCARGTVFSTITSYEGYNCMQWFAFHHSHYQKEYGMCSEESGPNALLDFFKDIGVPTTMRQDNSKMQDVIFNINPNDLIAKLIKVDGKPTGIVRQRMDNTNFHIKYKDGKQDMLTYNELIEALNHPNEENK
jgi:hypothetical protein